MFRRPVEFAPLVILKHQQAVGGCEEQLPLPVLQNPIHRQVPCHRLRRRAPNVRGVPDQPLVGRDPEHAARLRRHVIKLALARLDPGNLNRLPLTMLPF